MCNADVWMYVGVGVRMCMCVCTCVYAYVYVCVCMCPNADHGGPLDTGDIEELGGRECIRCPWHGYRIDVHTGEGLYEAMDGSTKSKGVKQRVHCVRVDGDDVMVRLNREERALPSDEYYF
jgi:nitrite reductase/ring-hydroxylating ferredoxin subunit